MTNDITEILDSAVAISAGYSHTCALLQGGAVKCWGKNSYGQLGDGTEAERLTAVDVVGLGSGVTAISAEGYHTCALLQGGAVKCWGYNGSGQLGDGTGANRLTAVDVVGLGSGVTAISAGDLHTCALLQGGAAKCWGYNGAGQLGSWSIVDVIGLVKLTPKSRPKSDENK